MKRSVSELLIKCSLLHNMNIQPAAQTQFNSSWSEISFCNNLFISASDAFVFQMNSALIILKGECKKGKNSCIILLLWRTSCRAVNKRADLIWRRNMAINRRISTQRGSALHSLFEPPDKQSFSGCLHHDVNKQLRCGMQDEGNCCVVLSQPCPRLYRPPHLFLFNQQFLQCASAETHSYSCQMLCVCVCVCVWLHMRPAVCGFEKTDSWMQLSVADTSSGGCLNCQE